MPWQKEHQNAGFLGSYQTSAQWKPTRMYVFVCYPYQRKCDSVARGEGHGRHLTPTSLTNAQHWPAPWPPPPTLVQGLLTNNNMGVFDARCEARNRKMPKLPSTRGK